MARSNNPDALPPLVDRTPTVQDDRILKAVAKALLLQDATQLQTAAELLLRRAEYERQSAELWARLPEGEPEDEPAPASTPAP
jgi:hypothetical protein